MKKTISLLVVLSLLMMLLSACSLPEKPSTDPVPTVYDVLNDLSKKEYSVVKIDVVTKTGFAELSANYTLKQDSVTYSVEQLNEISTNGSASALPSDYKTTVTGSAKIENGKVVSFDGNASIVLPTYEELKGSFNFAEENFKNVVDGENAFKADVVSPSAFYGADVNVSGMKVNVEYSESALIKIVISYQTAGATVETVYTFEK